MGNTEIIDTIVDPDVRKQFKDLQADSAAATESLGLLLKTATDLQGVLGNTKGLIEYQKQLDNANQTVKKAADNNEKARLAEIKLQQAREKAFDDYEKKLNKQIADQEKLVAKNAQATQKQVQDSQKLQQQLDKAAAAQQARDAKENQSSAVKNRAYNLAKKNRDEAVKNAQDIGIALGTQSNAFKDAAENAVGFQKKLDAVNQPLGNFKDNVGNYVNSFSRAFGFVRQLAYILPGIGIAGIFNILGEGIVALYNSISNSTGLASLDGFLARMSALKEAVNSSELKTGVQSVLQLTNDIKLAQQGFGDKDAVLVEYNKTLGETFGYTKSLDEAEQKLVAHSNDYIKSLFYKAAAQAVLAQGTEALVKAAAAQQRAEDDNRQLEKESAALAKETGKDKAMSQAFNIDKMIANNKRLNDETIKDAKKQQDEVTRITSDLYNNLQTLADKFGKQFRDTKADQNFSKGLEESQASILQRDIDRLEAIAANEQLSYGQRRNALAKLYTDQQALTKLNEKIQTEDGTKTQAELLKINSATTTELLNERTEYYNKLRELDNKQHAQQVEHTKNILQQEKDAAKLQIDSPGASFDTRYTALETYSKKSKALITLQYKQEEILAGQNAETLKLAVDHKNKSIIDAQIDYNAEYQKLLQDEYNAQLSGAKKHDTDVLNLIKTSTAIDNQEISESAKKQLDALDKQFSKGGGSYELYQAKREAIQKEANDNILQNEIDEANKIIALQVAAGQDSTQEQQKLAQLEQKQFEEKEKNKTFVLRKESELRKQLQAAEFNLATETIRAVQQVVDSNYEADIAQLKAQQDAVTETANVQKKAIDGSIQSSADKQRKDNIIDAKAAQQQQKLAIEQKKIKHQEAVFNRDASALGIAVSGAEAIAKIELEAAILAANPLTLPLVPLALAQIPVAIATTAVQEAAVFATKLPAYRHGTRGTTHTGPLLWGEAGIEAAREPSGQVHFSPDAPTVSTFPVGTEIIPNYELNRLLGPGKLKPLPSRVDVTSQKLDKLIAETRANRPGPQRPARANGWMREAAIGDSWARYTQKYFK